MSYLKELITSNRDECVELNDEANFYSLYRDYKPDWILIEIPLKNNNGFKLAEILKREFPEVKIALLSDFNDERLKIKSEEIGAIFIPKERTFEFYQLINSKEKMIGQESNFIEE